MVENLQYMMEKTLAEHIVERTNRVTLIQCKYRNDTSCIYAVIVDGVETLSCNYELVLNTFHNHFSSKDRSLKFERK